MKHMTLTMIAIAALGLAGCEASDPDGEGANVVTPDAEETTDAPETEPAAEDTPTEDAQGTRQNPLALGTAATIGDWQITVMEANTDAADIVEAENEFNEEPEEGEQFVIVSLEATYTGEDSGSIIGDFIYQVVGSGGNTFSESCGVIPDDIQETGETFTDGSVSGNLCFQVPSDQVDGGAFMMEGFTFTDTERTFWALQ